MSSAQPNAEECGALTVVVLVLFRVKPGRESVFIATTAEPITDCSAAIPARLTVAD